MNIWFWWNSLETFFLCLIGGLHVPWGPNGNIIAPIDMCTQDFVEKFKEPFSLFLSCFLHLLEKGNVLCKILVPNHTAIWECQPFDDILGCIMVAQNVCCENEQVGGEKVSYLNNLDKENDVLNSPIYCN
jgi:hypothetical protein